MVGALLGCAALLVLTPGAFAASGSISGRVTEKLSKGIPGVEVEVFTTGHELVAFAETEANGDYNVGGLAPGSYKVEFRTFESSFAPQYYNGALSFSAATLVTIAKEGETRPNIEAVLREGGKISGKVLGSHGEPLSGVSVSAIGSEFEGFAETNASGEYTVTGLAKDSYRVSFREPPGSAANLAPQYYENATSSKGAKPVNVEEGTEAKGISALLVEGGEISGLVTDAATHAPLAGVFVFADNVLGFEPEYFGNVTKTNGRGEYTIPGLLSGSYNLFFVAGSSGVQYIAQSVNGVPVTQGRLTAGINVALIRRAPVNTSPPVLSGTPTVGQTLSCSTGSWTGEPPLTFTYAWLRDGSVIGGASGSAYVVQPADQGHALTCRVRAKNLFSSSTATSNTLKVPSPPPPPPPSPPLMLESVSQSNSRWREGGKLASYSRRRPPVGTTFRFALNQQAVVSFAFSQQVGGRRVNGKCVAQTRANRRRRGCKRTVTQGTLTFAGHSGLNRVVFQGRVSRSKRLPLGAYTLRITAVNSAGQRSSPRSLNFSIVR